VSFRNLFVAVVMASILSACVSTREVREQTPEVELPSPQAAPPATEIAVPGDPSRGDVPDLIYELNALINPLNTTDAASSITDLEPVLTVVSGADIVGLGEATHGSSEFVTIRDRLIRELVLEHDFRHIAFEAPWAGIEVVDQYTLGVHDDAESARAGLTYFMLQNEEAWELITWLRDFNAKLADSGVPVRLIGIDPQARAAEAATFVLDFVENVDSARLEYFADLYAEIVDGSPSGYYLDQAREAYEELQSKSEEYIGLTTHEEYHLALTAARIVYQSREVLAFDITESNQAARSREEHMVENLLEYDRMVAGDSGVILWGHNNHIARVPVRGAAKLPTIGSLLLDEGDINYVALGFDFESGEFAALPTNDMASGVDVFSLGNAPEGTFAHTFGQLEYSVFILNLKDVDHSTSAGKWLGEPRQQWSVGCCFDPSIEAPQLIEVSMVESFDVLIFVRSVTSIELFE
jgi:erythromycin esterase